MWGPEGVYLTVMFWGPLKARDVQIGLPTPRGRRVPLPIDTSSCSAQGDSQTFNILSVENHTSGPHSWSFPAFAPLHLLVEETDDGGLLVYFFPELLSRLILSEIIPCSPQYGANLRYSWKRLCGVHHICSGPTSHIMHLFFNESHCSKFHSNQKNIYWIVAPLITCWFKCWEYGD